MREKLGKKRHVYEEGYWYTFITVKCSVCKGKGGYVVDREWKDCWLCGGEGKAEEMYQGKK